MFAFITYELKVAVVLAAFYLCFKLLLSRESLHRLNRVVLLSTSVLSFVLPLCIITLHKTVPMPEFVESGIIDEIAPSVENVTYATGFKFEWTSLLIVAYWIGVIAVLSSVVVGIIRVVKLINSGERKEMSGAEVIVCKNEIAPFSWMKWIVLSSSDYQSGNSHILEHEKAHIRFGHSKDVLLVDVLSAFQWFNPAIWLLKRDLRAVHEYEADDAVLRNGANIKEYQYSLIRKAVSASGYSITNSFNHSILKNRITMMSKSNASWMRWLRVIYILPLIGGTLALNARTVIDYEISEISSIEQKPIKVEVKMESGSIAYYVDGKKTSQDQLSQKLSSLKQNDGFDMVELVVDGNINMGTVTDLKDVFRSIEVSKIGSMTVTPKTGSSSKPQNPQNNVPKTNSAQESDTVPFQMVDVKPTFNGGDANEFSKWVNNNLKYPADAKAAGTQGRVTLTFTVSESGKVKDVKVLRGVDPSLDAEAVRVVSASPDWTPGQANGKKVSVTFTFPVIFQLAKPANGTQVEGTINDVTVVTYGPKKADQETATTDEVPVDFGSLTKKPTFNGGDASEFAKWVTAHLIYPESARNAGVQGRVTVKFKVNADGKISDVNVLRGICDALDDEAVRVVASAPAWTPGEVNGKAVATTYTFPIAFNIR